MASQQIPIHNVRDLVMARNALRKNLIEQGLNQPMVHARAAAAITAMAELILKAGATGILNMAIVEIDEKTGIELGCELSWLGGQLKTLANMRKRQISDAASRLNRVTNDVVCNTDDEEHPNLVARIWMA